jgi:c-di-AMP phosphodiesterase-like protein
MALLNLFSFDDKWSGIYNKRRHTTNRWYAFYNDRLLARVVGDKFTIIVFTTVNNKNMVLVLHIRDSAVGLDDQGIGVESR